MQPENGQHNKEAVVDTQESELGGRKRRHRGLLICGVILLGGALLSVIPLARSSPGHAAAGYAIATVLCVTLMWQMRLREIVVGSSGVVLIALLLRLPFLLVEPVLSGDVYRYLWDGRVAASGVNPYAHAPSDDALKHLQDDWHGSINHPDIPTIYPPLAQGLFWLWGLSGAGLWLMRLVLIAVDVAIIRMLGGRRGLFWAICPLVILEGTWSGHIEIFVAGALLATWTAIVRRRDGIGGLAFAAAIGLKITPIVAAPVFGLTSRKRSRFVIALTAGLVVPLLPFLGEAPFMPGFREYAVRWEFNGPAYELLKKLLEVANVDSGLKAIFTSIKGPLGLEGIAPLVYAHLYPAWIARALCLLPLAAILLLALRRPTFAGRIAWSVAALLLASPTVHPWYWIALLPLALVAGERLLLALAVASPLSYVWYLDAVWSEALALLLCYGFPIVVWLGWKRMRNRRVRV